MKNKHIHLSRDIHTHTQNKNKKFPMSKTAFHFAIMENIMKFNKDVIYTLIKFQ